MQPAGIDRAFWQERRVFVTGHTGFLGGWLCVWLVSLGARVAGYALAPPTRPSFFEAAGVGATVRSVIADIRDLEPLREALVDFEPQVIVHLAAQPLVRHAYAAPLETFAVNVMGTANLLQAIRSTSSVEAVVIVTTDKVYKNREWHQGYREVDRLGGCEPYGCSKACVEHVVDAFRHAYFSSAERPIGLATVRAGNVIGGGDWATDRLIPDAVRAFSAGRALEIRNPDAVRPWQHVLDPLHGMLLLAERLSMDANGWCGGWNLGPPEGEALRVREIAGELARLWGNDASWLGPKDDACEPYEAGLLALNPTKAAERLGWRQHWPLARALGATIDWYQAHSAGHEMRGLSLQQIAAFGGAN